MSIVSPSSTFAGSSWVGGDCRAYRSTFLPIDLRGPQPEIVEIGTRTRMLKRASDRIILNLNSNESFRSGKGRPEPNHSTSTSDFLSHISPALCMDRLMWGHYEEKPSPCEGEGWEGFTPLPT